MAEQIQTQTTPQSSEENQIPEDNLSKLIKAIKASNANEDSVLDENGAKALLEFLKNCQADDVYELVRILETIGDLARKEQNRSILNSFGFCEEVGKHVLSTYPEIQKMAARGIGNLCFDNEQNRVIFFERCQVTKTLVELLESPFDGVRRNVCGAIANMCADYEQAQEAFREFGGLSRLLKVVQIQNKETQSMALRALNNLITNKQNFATLIDLGLVDACFSLVDEFASEVDAFLENFQEADDSIKLSVLKHNGTKLLVHIAQSEISVESMKLVYEVITNIAGNEKLREELIRQNFFEQVIPLFNARQYDLSVRQLSSKIPLLVFIGLTEDDQHFNDFFKYFDLISKHIFSSEADVAILALRGIANLARCEPNCLYIFQQQKMVDRIFECAVHSDIRLNLGALGLIRNLSIPKQNKEPLLQRDILPILVKHISNRQNANQLIQYTAIGILKSLLVLGDPVIDGFAKAGGIEAIVVLARGEIPILSIDEKGEDIGKDPRVQLESARVIIRFIERDDLRKEIVQRGAIPPIIQLINSQHAILKAEGTKGLHMLAVKGDDEIRAKLKENNVASVLETLLAKDSELLQKDFPSTLSLAKETIDRLNQQ